MTVSIIATLHWALMWSSNMAENEKEAPFYPCTRLGLREATARPDHRLGCVPTGKLTDPLSWFSGNQVLLETREAAGNY